MGYNIYSYAIDLNKISSVFNSKDEEFVTNILKSEEFECYQDGLLDEDIKVSEAIRHIVFGQDYLPYSSHVYGYALIAICKFLGEKPPFSEKIKLGFETSLIKDYLKSDFNIDFVIEKNLFITKPQLGLPEVKNFPLSGILDDGQMRALLKLFEPINISKETIDILWTSEDEEDENKGYAYKVAMGTKQNLQYCLDNNLSLITFQH